MKLLFILLILSCTLISYAQEMGGGAYKFNTSDTPCLTDIQREHIIEQLKKSKEVLNAQNRLLNTHERAPSPLFIWPVIKSSTINYHENWAISNYVDHNLAYPGQVTDYNGGSRSYDTDKGNHRGIDISIWPYRWKTQDEDGLEVIAASDGQIIYKSDGIFDRNCTFNDDDWNAIYIQHNDGSVAWYGHLKSGSLTSKSIGSFVTQGEFLGIVGSSGNSTGPHLHFEVYADDSYHLDKLIDPYAGVENNWNSTSWWEEQKPYRNPTINGLTTNSAAPDMGECPEPEIPHEENNFVLNDVVYFTVFLKDQFETSFDLRVYKPDNSIAYDWHRELTDDHIASYYWYSRTLNSKGQWRLECTLSTGQVMNHYFTVGQLSTSAFAINNLTIHPNPVSDELAINSDDKIKKVVIRDALGKSVFENQSSFTGIKKVKTQSLSNGLYFLSVTFENAETQTLKFIKE